MSDLAKQVPGVWGQMPSIMCDGMAARLRDQTFIAGFRDLISHAGVKFSLAMLRAKFMACIPDAAAWFFAAKDDQKSERVVPIQKTRLSKIGRNRCQQCPL
jgi:hypothetical protein